MPWEAQCNGDGVMKMLAHSVQWFAITVRKLGIPQFLELRQEEGRESSEEEKGEGRTKERGDGKIPPLAAAPSSPLRLDAEERRRGPTYSTSSYTRDPNVHELAIPLRLDEIVSTISSLFIFTSSSQYFSMPSLRVRRRRSSAALRGRQW